MGGSGLNVRMAPGINQAITFESPERTLLTIIGGTGYGNGRCVYMVASARPLHGATRMGC
ncbi:MAG UNVERIFIED_CONTAM: hypothetical protein LVT10_07560 [Anaerolineae bacterium]